MRIIRNNKVFSLVGEYKQGEPLGITAKDIKYFKSSFGEVIEKSFGEVWRICSGTIGGLWNIIAHQQGLKSIGGPIAIAKESAKAGSAGLFALIYNNLNCNNTELGEGVFYVHQSFQVFILLRGTVPENALVEEAPSGAL